MYGDTGDARRAPAAFERLDDKDYSTRYRIECVDASHLLLGKSEGHQNYRIQKSFSRCHVHENSAYWSTKIASCKI